MAQKLQRIKPTSSQATSNQKPRHEQIDKSTLMRLGTMELLADNFDEQLLKGTPFYRRRKTITPRQISQRPAYRTMILLKHLDQRRHIRGFDEFYQWLQEPINDFDRQFPYTQQFLRTYGRDFQAQHYLLTIHNAALLFVSTH